MSDLKPLTLDVEWDLTDGLVFKSITGYRDIEDRVYTDWDAAEITLIEEPLARERSAHVTRNAANGSIVVARRAGK